MANYIYEKFKKLENDTTNDRLQVQKNINERLGGMSLVPLTKAEYTALTPKDSSTIYLVDDNGTYSLYVGDTQISGSGGDGIVKVKNAIVLEDRTRALANQLPGEGTAYSVSNHTELYRPTMSRTTRIYDGGYPSRFVPARGYNRYIIIGPNGELPASRRSDGVSTLTIILDRNGVEETLNFEVNTGRIEPVLIMQGFNYYLVNSMSYFIRCTRTINGTRKNWWYTGTYDGNYIAGGYGRMNTTLFEDVVPWIESTGTSFGYINHYVPTLTLGFSVDDVHDIANSVPKLILEIGNETVSTVSGTPYISDYGYYGMILNESTGDGKQLGILYDPDTGDLYSNPPRLKTPPTGIYLEAAKIAAYDSSEVT